MEISEVKRKYKFPNYSVYFKQKEAEANGVQDAEDFQTIQSILNLKRVKNS